LKKIERRNNTPYKKTRKRRTTEKFETKKEIFIKIQNFINAFNLEHAYETKWKNVKTMRLHILWAILYNYYNFTLKEIIEFGGLKRHQTISKAIIAIDKNRSKQNILLEINKKSEEVMK